MSQILSFQYTPDQFPITADAVRCAAFEYAKSRNCTGIALILVSLPEQKTPIQVVANLGAGESSSVLPLPDRIEETPVGTLFSFPSGLYIITEQEQQHAFKLAVAMDEIQNLTLFFLQRDSAQIHGFRRVGQNWLPAARSAEGAAAAAMVLHSDLENGTMESTIDQPGGLLEIGMRKENGKVTGLSAGGPVEVRR